MGFDPLMVMGGAVILGGLVGFLVGPFIDHLFPFN